MILCTWYVWPGLHIEECVLRIVVPLLHKNVYLAITRYIASLFPWVKCVMIHSNLPSRRTCVAIDRWFVLYWESWWRFAVLYSIKLMKLNTEIGFQNLQGTGSVVVVIRMRKEVKMKQKPNMRFHRDGSGRWIQFFRLTSSLVDWTVPPLHIYYEYSRCKGKRTQETTF